MKYYIDGREIDYESVEIEDHGADYPEFSDAYISSASFVDGGELSDEELDRATAENPGLLHDLAYDAYIDQAVMQADLMRGQLRGN